MPQMYGEMALTYKMALPIHTPKLWSQETFNQTNAIYI